MFDLNAIKYRQALGYRDCEEKKDSDISSMITEFDTVENNIKELEEECAESESKAEHYEDLNGELHEDLARLKRKLVIIKEEVDRQCR